MTISYPATPTSPGLLNATSILAGRAIASWRTQLGTAVVTWLFPVFVTGMFHVLFGGALQMPAGARYIDFLMPGMLAVTMLFGLETTTLSVAADASRGITDRFRTFPISSAAIVLGRCLADLLNSLIGLAVMVGFGLLIGWRPDIAVGSGLLALALLLLLRLSLLWAGIYIGYRARSVESVAYVQILVWPVTLLSSVFVDPTTMPTWLGTVAELNPISATANTVRDLLGSVSWPSQGLLATASSPVLAILWPALLSAVCLPLAARAYRARAR